MRVINQEQLKAILSNYTNNPRIIASGNFAAPKVLLAAADEVIPEFKLHMLNAHDGIPDREGITYETAFVGPAIADRIMNESVFVGVYPGLTEAMLGHMIETITQFVKGS